MIFVCVVISYLRYFWDLCIQTPIIDMIGFLEGFCKLNAVDGVMYLTEWCRQHSLFKGNFAWKIVNT